MSNPSYKIKLHNLRQSKNYPNPIPASESSKKSYSTTAYLGKGTSKIKDKVSINPNNRYKQFLKETMPYTELESSFRTKGKENLLNQQTTRKGLGAGLLKEIKRKMMKHIPGRLKKTY